MEAILDRNHISMRIEFDGASKQARIFSACLPEMRAACPGAGKSPFVIAHNTSPASAVAGLASALKGRVLRVADESRRVSFPRELDALSLMRKLEPATEAEKLALRYLTDVAVRMLVAFSLTREPYDNLWRATMGASLVQKEGDAQLHVPISIADEHPLLAIKDIARQLGGKTLLRRDMEFHAPALQKVRHTLLEEIRNMKKGSGK
jgi:hypothetical protein